MRDFELVYVGGLLGERALDDTFAAREEDDVEETGLNTPGNGE